MAALSEMLGNKVLNKYGEVVDIATHCAGKVVGFYFSAHWCPPCRGFTPVLADFYQTYSELKNFEIIFVSADNDEESFAEYYDQMPWLTIDFNEDDLKNDLNEMYEVQGIPKLVLVHADSGAMLTGNARSYIQGADTEGVNFPWAE